MRPLLLASLLALGHLAAADTPPASVQPGAYARARFADGSALLFGPTLPTPPVIATDDCQGLYARRVALMRAGLDAAPAFLDEPRHVAAVFVGTLWTPAFYYLPYRAVAATAGQARRARDQAELDALRQAAAQQRCFER